MWALKWLKSLYNVICCLVVEGIHALLKSYLKSLKLGNQSILLFSTDSLSSSQIKQNSNFKFLLWSLDPYITRLGII